MRRTSVKMRTNVTHDPDFLGKIRQINAITKEVTKVDLTEFLIAKAEKFRLSLNIERKIIREID